MQDYWLPTPLACFPFTSPPVRHRVPSGSEGAIHQYFQGIFCAVDTVWYTKHVQNKAVKEKKWTELVGHYVKLGFLFSRLSSPALGPTQPSIQWVPGHSPGVKWPGPEVHRSRPYSVEVKNE